jgi:hypothetical protein
MAMV